MARFIKITWHQTYLLTCLSFSQLNWELFGGQNHLSVSQVLISALQKVSKNRKLRFRKVTCDPLSESAAVNSLCLYFQLPVYVFPSLFNWHPCSPFSFVTFLSWCNAA